MGAELPFYLILLMKTPRNGANGTPKNANTVNSPAANPVHTSTPAAGPQAVVTAAQAGGAVTTVDVKADVGFGNAVFLRGSGGGLTWERGIPLQCVDGKTWRWSGRVNSLINFKPLLNDRIWSAGNDLTVKPGQKLEVQPTFC
jgi:hypothetical protein